MIQEERNSKRFKIAGESNFFLLNNNNNGMIFLLCYASLSGFRNSEFVKFIAAIVKDIIAHVAMCKEYPTRLNERAYEKYELKSQL